MRGENCVEANVSVISRMAKTMETTVMIDVAIALRITCATCGSCRDGNSVVGTHALSTGACSSSEDNTPPTMPSANAMTNGRIRKPPRNP